MLPLTAYLLVDSSLTALPIYFFVLALLFMYVKYIEYALLPESLGKDGTNKYGAPVDRLRSYFDAPIVTL